MSCRAVFDAAVPLWCEYFGVEPAKVADWKIVGYVIQDKERFAGAGFIRRSLPDFPNGFSQGSQLWLYDQPSGYYRRHLLLHEGTHCFMYRWLGGTGPPWYMEGMAELLGHAPLGGRQADAGRHAAHRRRTCRIGAASRSSATSTPPAAACARRHHALRRPGPPAERALRLVLGGGGVFRRPSADAGGVSRAEVAIRATARSISRERFHERVQPRLAARSARTGSCS